MAATAISFPTRWMVANTLALLFAYVLYTPIAHGFTGPHPRGMNSSQLIAHGVALAVVAVAVSAAQRHVLQRYFSVSWIRIPVAVILFIGVFWAGYFQRYLGGPDWDIIFGSVVLGSAVWLRTVPVRGHPVAAVIALLSFPVACFLGQLILFGAVLALRVVPDLQANVWLHAIYWIGVGLSMGVIGGWVSGLALRRMLPEAQATSHAASVRSAG